MNTINPTLALFNITGMPSIPAAGVVDENTFSKLLTDLNGQSLAQVTNLESPANIKNVQSSTVQTKTNEFVSQQINVEDLIKYLKTAEPIDSKQNIGLNAIDLKPIVNEDAADKKPIISNSSPGENLIDIAGMANFQNIPSATDKTINKITDISEQVQKIYQPHEIPKLNWNKNQTGQVDGADISFKHGQSELTISIRIDLKTNEISMSLPASTQLPIEQLKSIQNEFRDHINQSGLQVSWILEKNKIDTIVKTDTEQSFSDQNYSNQSQSQEQKKKNKHR